MKPKAKAKSKPKPKVPDKWIRNRSDEEAVKKGYWFDPVAAEIVCDFIEAMCRQSKGEWAGKPIELTPWQLDFLWRLYGWMRPDGFRRFKTAYLEIAKKNGKSTLCSALLNYHLIGDDEPGAECYVAAYDSKQTKMVYDEAVYMAKASPEIERQVKIYASDRRIVHPETNSFAAPFTHDPHQKEGKNASFIVFDELHTQKDSTLWNVLKHAGDARRQPLILSITTAGEDPNGPWHAQREKSEKINKGEIVNDLSHLGVVYRVPAETPDEELLKNESLWPLANPSLGATIKLDRFRESLLSAYHDPDKGEWKSFKRYKFNIIQKLEERWMDLEHWTAKQRKYRVYDGELAYIGLDLAEVSDLAALVVAYGHPAKHVRLESFFWMPEEQIRLRSQKDGQDYAEWVKRGFVTAIPGPIIDHEVIKSAIYDIAGRQELRILNADPWNAGQIGVFCRDNGIQFATTPQTYGGMSPLIKDMASLILSHKILHGNNPVLSWMFANTVIQRDLNGNLRFVKPHKAGQIKKGSKGKIDGIVAATLAVGAMRSDEANREMKGIVELG